MLRIIFVFSFAFCSSLAVLAYSRSEGDETNLESSNISQKQVNEACTDETTILPHGFKSYQQCAPPQWVDDIRTRLRSETRKSSQQAADCGPGLANSWDRLECA